MNKKIIPIIFKLVESDDLRLFIILKCHLDAELSLLTANLIKLWTTDAYNPPWEKTYQLLKKLKSGNFKNMKDALQQLFDPEKKLEPTTFDLFQRQGNKALNTLYNLIIKSDLLYRVGVQLLLLQELISQNNQYNKTPGKAQTARDDLESITCYMRSLLSCGLHIIEELIDYREKGDTIDDAKIKKANKRFADKRTETKQNIEPILSQLFNTFSQDQNDAQSLDPKCDMPLTSNHR